METVSRGLGGGGGVLDPHGHQEGIEDVGRVRKGGEMGACHEANARWKETAFGAPAHEFRFGRLMAERGGNFLS